VPSSTATFPPYAVVLDNPARVLKFRFSEEVIARLLEEKWWKKAPSELAERIEEFQVTARSALPPSPRGRS
jgi:hypothetical protein